MFFPNDTKPNRDLQPCPDWSVELLNAALRNGKPVPLADSPKTLSALGVDNHMETPNPNLRVYHCAVRLHATPDRASSARSVLLSNPPVCLAGRESRYIGIRNHSPRFRKHDVSKSSDSSSAQLGRPCNAFLANSRTRTGAVTNGLRHSFHRAFRETAA